LMAQDDAVPERMTLRVLAKKHIARDVAAGQLSLIEAATLFRVLNAPAELDALARQDREFWVLNEPVRTDDERICRQVVQWVSAMGLTESPECVAEAVARLSEEYRAEVCRHGHVRLPDWTGRPTAEELLTNARSTMTESERKMLFGGRGISGKR